ncbi:MAG: outer membrane beta-barrel protein [Planctomycetaceae bacterium]|nr:outer membrane beta-barrel protein [Planctomycetaceae bacterium]
MEKQFNNPQREPENRFTKRSRFTEDTIPLSATAESSKIRQVSDENVPQNQSQKEDENESKSENKSKSKSKSKSIWDNPSSAIGNEMTLSDWGIGSTSTTTNNPLPSTSSLQSPIVPGISYNQSGIFNGLGVNTPPNRQSGDPNAPMSSYSNIETSSNASPLLNNPYAYLYPPEMIPSNFSGFSGNTENPYGVNNFGYYPSNAGQISVNPYDPYTYYNNSYYNNGASASNDYYGQGNWGMYYPDNGAVQQMSGNEIAGQQNSLYQALFLQEMMLRQREREREEKSETEIDKTKKSDTEKTPESQWTMKRFMPIHVSSPLGETIFSGVKMISPFSTPSGPHRGVGQPLVNRSWLDHPYYLGGFCGWISGSQLVSGLIDQKNGGTGGLILGYNLNEYWGVESRLHFASIDIMETNAGRAAFQNWYTASNPGQSVPVLTTRNNRLSTVDIAVHYYPLGNAKWRPFFKYGLGFSRESFIDTYSKKHNENTVTMPFGIGLRYWWNENLAIQADLLDNVIFSSGVAKTQNNIAFCVGLTYSFGNSKKKRPTAYWPYVPSLGSRW